MGVKITRDGLAALRKEITRLTRQEVLVGIPADKTDRRPDPGAPAPPTNAALGYLHENGSPAQNIPPRPFLKPGIEAARDEIAARFKAAATAALEGNAGRTDRNLMAAGLAAQNAVRQRMTEGIPPPLSDRTLEARARRAGKGTGLSIAKGAQKELASRAAGNAPSVTDAKPLISTGQLRAAITYVIRKK